MSKSKGRGIKLLDILFMGGAGLVALYFINMASPKGIVNESAAASMPLSITLPHKVLERGLCPENVGFQCD